MRVQDKAVTSMEVQAKAKKAKDLKLYIRTRRSGTPTGETGHDYRTRKGLTGGEFAKHKFGKHPDEAKKRHWKTYSPMRRPSAR